MNFWDIKSQILGVNARNLLYINRFNSRIGKRFADDKISTKNYLNSRGIGAARLYGTIRRYKELANFNPNILPDSFVIKPNHGYGGSGITVIIGRKGDFYLGPHGRKYTWSDLFSECIAILDGKYAVSGLRDQVIFEELLQPDEYFLDFTESGLPDVRVIVFNMIPVIAMLRLPTAESAGKANLHLGAIGLGIDIGTGKATTGVLRGKFIRKLSNGKATDSIVIPKWDEVLLTSSKVQQVSKVGFLGVDLALTKTGIKVLEINARAGLNIQIANRVPLRSRLDRVSGLAVTTPEEAVRVAKTLFGRTNPFLDKSKPSKPVIGLYESVEILNTNFGLVLAKIDPHASRNLVDRSLSQEIKDKVMSIKIGGSRINLPVEYGNLEKHDYKIILAGKYLRDFLINLDSPTIKVADSKRLITTETKEEKIIKNIDRKIFQIDKELGIIPRFRPINLASEKAEFFSNQGYSPKFIYKKYSIDFEYLKKEIKKIPRNIDHPLMPVFDLKLREINRKISLLQARGSSKIQYYSEKIYGRVTKEMYQEAVYFIKKFQIVADDSDLLPFKKVYRGLEVYLRNHKLSHWSIKVMKEMTSDISVSRRNVIFLKDNVKFTTNRLAAVIAHEIDTHVFRLENARKQPYKIFEIGTDKYILAEEGLAIYNQTRQGLSLGNKTIWPALNMIAVYLGRTHSFYDLFKLLIGQYGISHEEAWKTCLKVKRGLSDTEVSSVFSRDFIYFAGQKKINDLVSSFGEGKLRDLYIGKIAIEDLENLNKLKLIKPSLLPKYDD